MAESHVISGLVAKCSELAGKLEYHQKQIRQAQQDINALQAAIRVMDSGYDLRTIKTKQIRSKNSFFRRGEGSVFLMDILREADGPISTAELIERAAFVKGYDLKRTDRRSFTASIFKIVNRLRNKGIVEEVGREDGVIIWNLTD